MKKRSILTNNVIIYQGKDGGIELKGDITKETVWATQAQIAEVFGIERSVITKHLRNIYKEGELEHKATCANFAQVQTEGKRQVERQIEYYNLDAILSVGYRVNSKLATQFRKWATQILKQHLIAGYTINRSRIAQNYDAFIKSIEQMQALLPEHTALAPKIVLELIKEFAGTWMSLNATTKAT